MRRLGSVLAAAVLVVGPIPPAHATEPVGVLEQLIADSSALAFAVRPTYDSGGAAPLHLYVGYADANVTDSDADGQASWYNLNLVEAAAFRPPESCTPQRNADATIQGVQDVQAWLGEYVGRVTSAVGEGRQPPPPTVPGPRHACTERLPGFAQSRYPETNTIPREASDNLLDKPTAAAACREQPESTQCKSYKDHWPAFAGALRTVVRDGSFAATATEAPSQRSEALLFGAGDGALVSVGSSRLEAGSRIDHTSTEEGDTALVTEASATLDDLCLVQASGACIVEIERLRQFARITQIPGEDPQIDSGTVIVGLRGPAARDVTARDLMLNQAKIDLGGSFQVEAVSHTGSCDVGGDPGWAVADAGGIRVGGRGDQGGSVTIGGACARSRLDSVAFEIPSFDASAPVGGTPGHTITIPGAPVGPGPGASQPGEPRVVERFEERVRFLDPIAWRTAPYWASVLGALGLGSALLYAFRAKPAVAPAVRAVDRFARAFLRG